MESRFGRSFRGVSVHTEREAATSARLLQAKAYTVGNDVVFSQGHFAPDTSEGKRLLAHELAHVVQQSRGGSVPPLHPDSPLEQAADRAAEGIGRDVGAIKVGGGSAVGIARQQDDQHQAPQDAAVTQLPGSNSSLGLTEFPSPKRQPGAQPASQILGFDWQKAADPPTPQPVIPPPKPGELTRDLTVDLGGAEPVTLAKANVEGERARIVKSLDIELKAVEGRTETSRNAARQFLEQWPIM
jgi:hypothetical protein